MEPFLLLLCWQPPASEPIIFSHLFGIILHFISSRTPFTTCWVEKSQLMRSSDRAIIPAVADETSTNKRMRDGAIWSHLFSSTWLAIIFFPHNITPPHRQSGTLFFSWKRWKKRIAFFIFVDSCEYSGNSSSLLRTQFPHLSTDTHNGRFDSILFPQNHQKKILFSSLFEHDQRFWVNGREVIVSGWSSLPVFPPLQPNKASLESSE